MFLRGDFTGQGFYNITISMSQKDYKKYKKIISQMVASCQIREWEPENATVSESIENVENTENNDLMILGTLLDRTIRKEDTDNKYKIIDEVELY